MLIIPAIDIMDGQCVRLTKGEFGSKKVYFDDPISVAKQFEKEGAQMLHVVDLDGAKAGKPANQKLILKIRDALNIPIQIGGGIRDFETALGYLGRVGDRIILGTKALSDPTFTRELLQKFGPEMIVVSLDIKDGRIATNGWAKVSSKYFLPFANELKSMGLRTVVVTDIDRDGTLTEPNYETLVVLSQSGLRVVASGGVADIESLVKLKNLKIDGAIVGKALYEKKFTLADALAATAGNSNLTKRLIPCLDVAEGRVVKGTNFLDLQDAGDPVALGKKYSEEGADELIFLDIMASKEDRKTMLEMVKKVAQEVFIPFTVGGGMRSVQDIRETLQAGADKVSINTAAVRDPSLITRAAAIFGRQCIVVAIDVKKRHGRYKVFVKGGSQETELEAVAWAKQAEQLGAGEILLTSMDRDGTKKGFDTELLRAVSSAVNIPVIASGGAGSLQDFAEALTQGKADAVLAASLFHYQETSLMEAKKYLAGCNIPIRL